MSSAITMNPSAVSGQALNDCGCCEGTSKETPVEISNRPGLSAIAYRVGTHPQFKETMLAQLSGSRLSALSHLTTRADDDFAIALLDAWATVGDVLTFYQERIVNEAYLRTATERFSVRELARLIDYQLSPGVAASTYLVFALEEAPGALGQALSLGTTAQSSTEPLPPIVIDAGTKVQSVPAPGEQAQTFETVEKIDARAEWNAITPRLTQPQEISLSMKSVFIAGTSGNLKQGDRLLIVEPSGRTDTKIIIKVTTDDDAKTTQVDFVSAPSLPAYSRASRLSTGRIDQFMRKTQLTEMATERIVNTSWQQEDLVALASLQRWDKNALIANIRQSKKSSPLSKAGVFAYRQRAALFGHNAPKQPTYANGVPKKPVELGGLAQRRRGGKEFNLSGQRLYGGYRR